MMLMTACVVATTRFYLPAPGEHRISPGELRDRADAILHAECPHLLHGRDTVFGTANLTLYVDSAGRVLRAAMARGSGNPSVDAVLGALAAQLALEPPPASAPREATERLAIGYGCATNATAVTVTLRP